MDRFRAFLIHHPSPVHFGAFRVMAILAMHLVASRGILLRRLGRRRPDGTHDKWQGQKRRQKHQEKKYLPTPILRFLATMAGSTYAAISNAVIIVHAPFYASSLTRDGHHDPSSHPGRHFSRQPSRQRTTMPSRTRCALCSARQSQHSSTTCPSSPQHNPHGKTRPSPPARPGRRGP